LEISKPMNKRATQAGPVVLTAIALSAVTLCAVALSVPEACDWQTVLARVGFFRDGMISVANGTSGHSPDGVGDTSREPPFSNDAALLVSEQDSRSVNQQNAPSTAQRSADRIGPAGRAAVMSGSGTTSSRRIKGEPQQVRQATATSSEPRDASLIFAGGAPTSVDELRGMQKVMQTLSAKVQPATVSVRVGLAQGSGVIIDKEGHVLSAAHVVGAPGRDVVFILHDGRQVRGRTLGCNYDLDAGLMKITDRGDWTVAEMGDSNNLQIGQWCLATGHPGGYQRGRTAVVRFGRILNNLASLVATDCTLVGGDSGGPLFDMDGRVIAIHSRIGNSLSANIHVPISAYRDSWERLKNSDAWGTQTSSGPFIGVVGDEKATNATIAAVNSGSPAERAGIRAGDVITRFAGEEVTTFESLSKLVRKQDAGETVPVVVQRGSTTLKLTVLIGDRSD